MDAVGDLDIVGFPLIDSVMFECQFGCVVF